MTNHPDISEERLTAYFDGQLPPEEQIAVEKLLANDLDGQQIQSGNRSVREHLQQLPSFRLPTDFSGRVSTEARLRAAGPDIPPAPVDRLLEPRSGRWMVSRVAGRALALAASLVFAVWLGWGVDLRVAEKGGDADLQYFEVDPLVAPAGEDGSPGLDRPRTAGGEAAGGDGLHRVKQPVGGAAVSENKSWLLLVYEIAVTPEGVHQKVIEQALANSGIALVDHDIKVSQQLGKALLESKFLNGARALDPATLDARKRTQSEDEIRLIYAAATAGAIERAYQTLKSKNREVAAIRMSVAMEPKDPATIAHQRLVQSVQPQRLLERLGQARRLAFDTLLLTRSARIFSQSALLPMESAEGQPARIPLQPGIPLGDGKDMPSEALFVVHYLKQDLRRNDR